MTRKCTLKCHHCQRIRHRVKDCTIPKRKKKSTGRAQALGTLVLKLVQSHPIISVWDEFPKIVKPARLTHVTSVWDELKVIEMFSPQQGFPKPIRRVTVNITKPYASLEELAEASSDDEIWYDAPKTIMEEA